MSAMRRAKTLHSKKSEMVRALDEARLEELLAAGVGEPNLGTRIEKISGCLLGCEYIENPLGGGPEAEEFLTISLDGFDCVTYIETVLAAALARTTGGFVRTIRELRYAGGRVEWAERNHYMTDWARNNRKVGLLVSVTKGPETVEKARRLNLIPGLPRKVVNFRCFPKRRFNRVADRIETGDLMFFVSAKGSLDVFHTGLLVRSGDGIVMRHATRTAGVVIEQPVEEFLKNQRMSGFVLLRPVEKKDAR